MLKRHSNVPKRPEMQSVYKQTQENPSDKIKIEIQCTLCLFIEETIFLIQRLIIFAVRIINQLCRLALLTSWATCALSCMFRLHVDFHCQNPLLQRVVSGAYKVLFKYFVKWL